MLYIVHVQIDRAVAAQWATWMTQEHLPDVLATGCFEWALMSRDESSDTPTHEGHRFSYLAKDLDAWERYQARFAPALRQDHIDRFGAHAIASRELLPTEGYLLGPSTASTQGDTSGGV